MTADSLRFDRSVATEAATGAATNAPRSITFADIERVARDLQSLPKGKWMIIAPDGRMWQDESPRKIAQAAAMEAFLTEPFAPIPFGSQADTDRARSDEKNLEPPQLDEVPDNELPGMWERADFMGGQDEVRRAAPPSDAALLKRCLEALDHISGYHEVRRYVGTVIHDEALATLAKLRERLA